MAFAARLGVIIDELVQSTTGLSATQDSTAFDHIRQGVLTKLKSHSYLRTNQFDVANRLYGLEERFRINHREGLADVLRQSLDTLEETCPSKWNPDILHLLLELSDQPTFKTRLADVEALNPPPEETPEGLRWETVAREDGWDDDDAALWKTIRYDDSSSEDDYLSGDRSEDAASDTTGSGDGDVGRTAEVLIIRPDDADLLQAICQAQQWRIAKPSTDTSGHARKIAVSELQVVREVLFMLQGLDTTIFDARCNPLPSFQTRHLLWDTHRALINTFTETGRLLRRLRKFAQDNPDASHLQAFQDCVVIRLSSLDARLSDMHSRLASPPATGNTDAPVVASLMSLRTDVAPWTEPLCILSTIIARVGQEHDPGPFRYLELLYDEANLMQLSGKPDLYEFLARIFVECFNVYLRPVRLWMDEGKLLRHDKMFFIYEVTHDTALSDIWRSRFHLRLTPDGSLHAPAFLRPAASKILNAGKSLVVLAQLGIAATSIPGRQSGMDLGYDTVCPPGSELAPFSYLFATAFDRWLESRYSATSTTLRNALFGQCRLVQSLEALQLLYLMSDGSAASGFCQDVFERIGGLYPRWHDGPALTAIGHEHYPQVDANRLLVSVTDAGQSVDLTQARDCVQAGLPHIRLTYRLPWPIQMVLSPGVEEQYQAVFTLLLQLRRATYALHRPRVLDGYWTDHERWPERALYYLCRNKLVWFCATVQTYLATLVLTPCTVQLRRDLLDRDHGAANDVDAIAAVHDAFIKNVVDQACLGSRLAPIRHCILDIFDLAVRLEKHHATPPSSDYYVAINADFDKNLRFMGSGLRSVARASSDVSAAKWDTLAEMLQTAAT
ncbi:gamma-tubulin complex component 5 [Geosmithia morbida]|uniref:Spindle pole body component n=1 Tax=Geosmithia morbida TaxID=1094350 RepID=A0A9P5D378_9HYPO|nr:gamma-tubulin complex component 5 [Geosmithia morbida]KAF4120229.1 gamma-tubulin complex component 5 [Geosmithia morbida]